MPNVDAIVAWVEAHETTVDLLKWVLLLLVAWAAGLFRYLRNLTRSPKVRVSELTSRCFIEEMEQFDAHRNAVRAAILAEVEVANRSSEPIVVWALEARIYRSLLIRRWGPWISASSLPNRVQHKMASRTKIMRNWFSHLSGEMPGLTITGKIEPKHAESGFALFVSFTHGTWNPVIVNNSIRIRVRVRLTTGEKLEASARIPVTRNAEFFEGLVPGVLEHIRHPGAWNLPIR